MFFIRIDFSDTPGAAQSEAALDELLNTTVANSISAMSYGKTTINATVSSMTVRMPQPTSHYLPSSTTLLYNDARDAYLALTSPTALNGYDIIGVQFPAIGMVSGSGVSFAGLATIGGSRQWIQGATGAGVLVHEFGHNYGLGHASFWDTNGNSVVGTGTNNEYGDLFDIMGSGPVPASHFHMQAKQRLNWLDANQWLDTTTSGIRRVHRFDDPATTGASRALRITKATSPDEYYWVGFRPGIPGNSFLQNGAYLVWQRPSFTRSWLLDTTPGSAEERRDSAIPLGKTYSDFSSNIHITPLAVGGTFENRHLDINVQLGPFPENLPPSGSLTVPPTATARTPVALTINASDPNSDPLAYSWDFGDSSPSTNLSTTTHNWLTGGSRTVTAVVSDMKGGTATLTSNLSVTDPLDTWQPGNVGASRAMNHVRFLEGRFLAGGNNSNYLSLDGINWLEKNLGNNYHSRGFAFQNNAFIAVGYDWSGSAWFGKIHRSTDGITWQETVIPPSAELGDVAAGTGLFVAVGDGGTILRSHNGGETWTAQPAPTSTSLTSVAFGDGTFVTVGGNELFTSTDGITWHDRSNATGIASWHNLKTVHFANGTFVTGGWYSGLRVSTDNGISWQQAEIIGGANYDIRSVSSGGGAFLAHARRQPSPSTNVLLVSTDGLRWMESEFGSYPTTDALAYGGGRFITVHGSGGQTLLSDPFITTNQSPSVAINAPSNANAREFITFSANASDPDGDPLLLVWNFKDGNALKSGGSVSYVFIAGGTYQIELTATDSKGGVATTTHSITIADPLDTWTTRVSGTTAPLNDIIFSDGKLVAVGGGNGTHRISTDGITWIGGTISNNVNLHGIAHDSHQFVAVGMDYDFSIAGWQGVIYTSANATSWTRRHSGGPELRDVTFGNGSFVAVGDNATVWTSSNGTSWHPASTGTTTNLRGIDFGNNTFVAVGAALNGGSVSVLTSTDGDSWINQSAGAGLASWQSFHRVCFANDRFLASGWFSRIRHSIDNGASFQTNESLSRQTPAIAYGNQIYLAAGIDQSNSDADINLISTDGENWTPLTTADQPNRNAAIFFNNTFITVGQGGSIRQSDAFTAPEANPYLVWQNLHFPGNPPLSGPGDDYDGDGIAKFGEYATGTDPKNPTDRVAFDFEVIADKLTLSIPKNPDATGVTTRVESSYDLLEWGTIGLVIEQDSPELLVVRLNTPLSSASLQRAFLRVVFEQ